MRQLTYLFILWTCILAAQEKSSNDTNSVILLNNRCKAAFMKGNYDSAIHYTTQAKKIAEVINWQKGLSQCFNNLGLIYKNQGLYAESLRNHFAALQIREKMGDKKGISASNNNIGNVYSNQLNYPEAIKHYKISHKINEELGNIDQLASSHNNLGGAYKDIRNYSESLKHHFAALKLRKEIGDSSAMAYSYTNIGNVYQTLNDLEKALENYQMALRLIDKGDDIGLSTTYINLSGLYIRKKQWGEAKNYASRALSITKKIGELEGMKEAYHCLADIYDRTGDYDKALKNYKSYVASRDSLMNEESTRKSVRLEMNYEFQKKEAAARLEQNKRDAIAVAEERKQRLIIWSICGILLMVTSFAVFAFRSYKQKKRANDAITQQKLIIEEKQKEIVDSIHYAKRIQSALMSSERSIEKNLRRMKNGIVKNESA